MASQKSIVGGIAARYANALFDLALDAGALEQVEAELRAIDAAIKDSADFSQFIRSPIISRDEQASAMRALLERAGASSLTQNFVGVIVKNRRLFALPQIIGAFVELAARRRGELSAEVVSAHPLNDKQTQRLKEQIKSALGRDVQLTSSVDPSLLGGLVVKIGSRMVDSSIRTKLSRLQSVLKEA